MAVVKFDELTGVVVPDSSEIREDFAKGIVKAFRSDPDRPDVNVEPTSPMGQVVDLVAAEIEAKNAEIAYLANQLNPQTARGVFLDAIGGLYGIDRTFRGYLHSDRPEGHCDPLWRDCAGHQRE